MTVSGLDLIKSTILSFSKRKMPKSIISLKFDVSFHIEASRVKDYIESNKEKLKRSNSTLIAFNYVTPETALWILPKYVESTIINFEDDDFMLVLLAGALASGMPGGKYTAQKDLGVRMRGLATDDEAECICLYLKWLQENTDDIGIDETLEAGIKLWCIENKHK